MGFGFTHTVGCDVISIYLVIRNSLPRIISIVCTPPASQPLSRGGFDLTIIYLLFCLPNLTSSCALPYDTYVDTITFIFMNFVTWIKIINFQTLRRPAKGFIIEFTCISTYSIFFKHLHTHR